LEFKQKEEREREMGLDGKGVVPCWVCSGLNVWVWDLTEKGGRRKIRAEESGGVGVSRKMGLVIGGLQVLPSY
jgi:hypothetical protein